MRHSLKIVLLTASLGGFSSSYALDMGDLKSAAADATKEATKEATKAAKETATDAAKEATQTATDSAKQTAKDTVDKAKEAATEAASSLVDLNGQWQSAQLSTVTLQQKGSAVTGQYTYAGNEGEHRVGEYSTKMNGNVLVGTWREWIVEKKGEPENEGDVEWKIVNGGKDLMGQWRDKGEEEWGGDWNLNKQ